MMRDVFRWIAVKGASRQTYLLTDQYVFTVVTGGAIIEDAIAWNFISPEVAQMEALRFTRGAEQMGWVIGDTVWFNHLDVDARRLLDLCARAPMHEAVVALAALEDAVVLGGEMIE